MGTTFEVYLYASDSTQAAVLIEAAFQEVERVEAALSNYRPASEISRINAMATRNPVVTDPEVFGLIDRALDYSRRTDGAFDITVGALVQAWGFFRGRGHYPSPEELEEARARVGWRKVALHDSTRSIEFLTAGIELDLGGIGKGYALDRAAGILRRNGVSAALLGSGQSSYYAIGNPAGTAGWRIAVPNPFDTAQMLSTIWLRDGSLSTSGNNQKFFELDGRRYSHIIDPRTGEPATGMVQVTVTASSATDSDALATALFVTGAEHANDIVAQYGDVAALLVKDRGGAQPVVSIGWGSAIALLNK